MASTLTPSSTIEIVFAPRPTSTVVERFRCTVALVDSLLRHGYEDCENEVERGQWVLLLADWLRGEALTTYSESCPLGTLVSSR